MFVVCSFRMSNMDVDEGSLYFFLFIFFFSFFGWEDNFQLGSWCEGRLKLISSQEKTSKRLILEVTGFRY